jgi:hypothetical protein
MVSWGWPAESLGGQVQKTPVEAEVAGQFRVEGSRQQVALPHRHRATVGQLAQRCHTVTQPDDDRGSDEYGMEGRAVEPGYFQVLLKAVNLPPESVALHPNVHYLQWYRVLLRDFLGHHNHPGASAPDSFPFLGHPRDGFPKVVDTH